MTLMTLDEAFLLNPMVPLPRGAAAPFVDMASLQPFTRDVRARGTKPFAGGMKFIDGDVLMARITPSLENGKTSIYRSSEIDTGPAFGSTEFIVVRGRPGISDSTFAYYLFTSPIVRQHAIASMNGSSGRQRVQHDSLATFKIDLPPLEEQRGIAATLGALDDKIDSNHTLIGLLDQLIRAAFAKEFSTAENPDGVPISDLIEVNPRRLLAKGASSTYVGMSSLPEFWPVVSTWEAKPFGSGQRFRNGDVLLARITPCLENGKTAIVDMLPTGEIGWGSTEYVVLSPRGDLTSAWVYALARDETIRSWAIRSMSGTSGRQRFDASRFHQYRIAAPAPQAIGHFNRLTNPALARISALRDESAVLAALRDTLIPELLSGRVRVPAEVAA